MVKVQTESPHCNLQLESRVILCATVIYNVKPTF